MKVEACLFGGVALFFAATAIIYGWFSHDPAGSAALIVSFLMSALIGFYFSVQYQRHGKRPEDHRNSKIAEGADAPVFFPPHSGWPFLMAAGFAVTSLGVALALWLFLLGAGLLLLAVCGFTFQYASR